MIQIVKMTDEEKLQMYRGNCTFDELAKMHIELEKRVQQPQWLTDEEIAARALGRKRGMKMDAEKWSAIENLQNENSKLKAALAEKDSSFTRLKDQYMGLQRDKAELMGELETERIRLAACGVAAMANTEETRKQRIDSSNPYFSASYSDVCSAVDREIEYRTQLAELREKVRDDLHAAVSSDPDYFDLCPDCGRRKAKDAVESSMGFCPKWWAIHDTDAAEDCRCAAGKRGKNMKCPKCKTGDLEYYKNNHYIGCTNCDFRNGFVKFILKVRKALGQI